MYTGFSVWTLLKFKVQCFFGVLLVVVMRSNLLERFAFSFYQKGTRFLCLNLFVSGLCCNGLFMSKKCIQMREMCEVLNLFLIGNSYVFSKTYYQIYRIALFDSWTLQFYSFIDFIFSFARGFRLFW